MYMREWNYWNFWKRCLWKGENTEEIWKTAGFSSMCYYYVFVRVVRGKLVYKNNLDSIAYHILCFVLWRKGKFSYTYLQFMYFSIVHCTYAILLNSPISETCFRHAHHPMYWVQQRECVYLYVKLFVEHKSAREFNRIMCFSPLTATSSFMIQVQHTYIPLKSIMFLSRIQTSSPTLFLNVVALHNISESDSVSMSCLMLEIWETREHGKIVLCKGGKLYRKIHMKGNILMLNWEIMSGMSIARVSIEWNK